MTGQTTQAKARKRAGAAGSGTSGSGRAVEENGPAAGSEVIEAYLAALPEPVRSTLITVRERIRAATPAEATEGLGYGVPAFQLGKQLAGYAAGKKFCSYYPMSGRVIHELRAELQGYETTSGAIHFGLDKPLPAALIRKLVKARLAEIQARK